MSRPSCICPKDKDKCNDLKCEFTDFNTPYTPDKCRVCWLFHTHPGYHATWSDNTDGPSFVQKAINFGNAVITHVQNGGKNVPDNVAEQRMEICKGCVHFIKQSDSCQICGCKLSLKTKWAAMRCPLPEPKWTEYNEQ